MEQVTHMNTQVDAQVDGQIDPLVEALEVITSLKLDRLHCVVTGQPIGTVNQSVIESALQAYAAATPKITSDELVAIWEEHFFTKSFIIHPATTIHRLMKNRFGAEKVKAQSVAGLRELFCMYVMAIIDPPMDTLPRIIQRNELVRDLWIMSDVYSHQLGFLNVVGGLAMLDEKYGMVDMPNSMTGARRELRKARAAIQKHLTDGDLFGLYADIESMFACIRAALAANGGQLPDATIERKRPVMRSMHLSKAIAFGFTEEQSQDTRFMNIPRKANEKKKAAATVEKRKTAGTIVNGKLQMNAAQKAAVAHAMKQSLQSAVAARASAQSAQKGGVK